MRIGAVNKNYGKAYGEKVTPKHRALFNSDIPWWEMTELNEDDWDILTYMWYHDSSKLDQDEFNFTSLTEERKNAFLKTYHHMNGYPFNSQEAINRSIEQDYAEMANWCYI